MPGDEDEAAEAVRAAAPQVHTSFRIFVNAVRFAPDAAGGTRCDASGILETPCFEAWVASRRGAMQDMEEAYRRVVTMHVTGTKKRQPLPAEIEASLLVHLRKPRVWPCFEGRISASGRRILIGLSGFRAQGFHERGPQSAAAVAGRAVGARIRRAGSTGDAVSESSEREWGENAGADFEPADAFLDLDAESGRSNETMAASARAGGAEASLPLMLLPQMDVELMGAGLVFGPLSTSPRAPLRRSLDTGADQQHSNDNNDGNDDLDSATLACTASDAADATDADTTDAASARSLARRSKRPRASSAFAAVGADGPPLDLSEFDAEGYLWTASQNAAQADYLAANRAAWEADPRMFEYVLHVFGATPADLGAAVDGGPNVPVDGDSLFGDTTAASSSSGGGGGTGPAAAPLDLRVRSRTLRGSVIKSLCHAFSPDRVREVLNSDAHARVLSTPGGLNTGLEAAMARMRVSDPRFMHKFRFPALQSAADMFDARRPVGHIVLDHAMRTVLCSPGAALIVGRNAQGQVPSDVHLSPAAFWLFMRDAAPVLALRGEGLFQAVVRRPSTGAAYVSRMHFRQTREGGFHVTFQDVSHLYPDILALPPFNV